MESELHLLNLRIVLLLSYRKKSFLITWPREPLGVYVLPHLYPPKEQSLHYETFHLFFLAIPLNIKATCNIIFIIYRTFFISRDIAFFEDSSPFQSVSHPTQLADPFPKLVLLQPGLDITFTSAPQPGYPPSQIPPHI